MVRCKKEALAEQGGRIIQNNGDGYVTIRRPDEKGDIYEGYCYSPEQTRLIAVAATESLAKRDNAAILVGGAQHGKVVFFRHTGAHSTKLPRLTPIRFAFESSPYGHTPGNDYDEYYPTGAFTFAEGKCCAILEHADLGRLQRLETDIKHLTQQHDEAARRINKASSEKAAAELSREDIGSRLAKLCEERDRLKWGR